MSWQKLLVLSLVVVTLTGCNHHRRHPHRFRQPGLHGDCDHHGHCRKCGRRAARRHASYQSLFPGDIYGYYGEYGGAYSNGCSDGCCDTGFMESGGWGPDQFCNACEMPYAGSCNDCGCLPAATSYGSCMGCSSSGMSMNSPTAPATSAPGCNCDRQQVPMSAPQQALPPVPQDATAPADAEPNVNGEATAPMDNPPAAVPPIDPVSWQIPNLPSP